MMRDFMSFNLVSLSTKDLQRILESIKRVQGLNSDMPPSEWYGLLHTLIARSMRLLRTTSSQSYSQPSQTTPWHLTYCQ
jgi:hypothetical protein